MHSIQRTVAQGTLAERPRAIVESLSTRSSSLASQATGFIKTCRVVDQVANAPASS